MSPLLNNGLCVLLQVEKRLVNDPCFYQIKSYLFSSSLQLDKYLVIAHA